MNELNFEDLRLAHDALRQEARNWVRAGLRGRTGRTHKKHTENSRWCLSIAKQYGMASRKFKRAFNAELARLTGA